MDSALPQAAWADMASRGRVFSDVFESSMAPCVVVDVFGCVLDVNTAMVQMVGVRRGRMRGHNFVRYFDPPEQAFGMLQRILQKRVVHDCALKVAHAAGTCIDVACNATLFRDAQGQVLGAFLVLRDTTDLRQYEAQMLVQARYDVLTALPNRRYFFEQLSLSVAQRGAQALAVLFIDLDNFKDINDTLGHVVGDAVLKMVALQLASFFAPTDLVARMGGNGFSALVHAVDSPAAMRLRVEALLHAINTPRMVESQEVLLSCSIGFTLSTPQDMDGRKLLRNAEAAMYRAKEDGKNRVQLFTEEMDVSIRKRVDIGQRLRGALQRREFVLHYQPRVSMRTGAWVGVEALIRWQTEGAGLVSPADFIPIAERNGMIAPIGEWVLFEACRQARQWQLEMGLSVQMAVNLSARQLRDVDIVDLVARALAQTGLAPHLLELELTESILVQDTARVLREMEALKAMGVRLSIDDFGTGYSSLSYLKCFPLDYLKVDRSFVQDLPHDADNGAIVRSIIEMAHTLGMHVIAEGVETREQMEFLRQHGSDEIQGYYCCKPLPQEDLRQLFPVQQAPGASADLLKAHPPAASNAWSMS